MEVIEFKLISEFKPIVLETINGSNISNPEIYDLYMIEELNKLTTHYTPNLNNTNNITISSIYQNRFDFVVGKLNKLNPLIMIENMLCQVKVGGHLIVTFDYNEIQTEMKSIEKKLVTNLDRSITTHHTNVGLLIIKKHPTISVILNTFNRLKYLNEQINAVSNQTIKPIEIYIWNNSPQQILISQQDRPNISTTVFNASTNMGVWSRFFAGFNCRGKYIAVFDDDTIPGEQWFQNCLNCMKIQKGLYGTTGYKFGYGGYHENVRVGWLKGNQNIEEVDIIGHAWFFKKKWLKHFPNEIPDIHYQIYDQIKTDSNFNLCGEDIHLSYTLKRYGAIRSFVPPQTTSCPKMCGSIMGFKYGTDEAALSLRPGMDDKFETVFKHWVYRLGHSLTLYEEIINCDQVIGPFQYEWIKTYQLLRQKKNFALIRFGDGELCLMKGIKIKNDTQASSIDGWIWTNDHISQLGKDLSKISENTPDPNIYYGFATSDNIVQFRTFYNFFKQCLFSIKNIVYANQFINSNYVLTDEFIFSDLYKKKLGKVVVVCNNSCKSYVDQHGYCWITEAIYFPDDIANWWEINHIIWKSNMIELAKKYTNTLFMFAVGPLSKVLINLMYHTNPNNRYVDMGSALDLVLKNSITRGYQLKNNHYSTHSDKVIKFCDNEDGLNSEINVCEIVYNK
ncbi:MAG: hypothetical protein Homavirus3_6 [Homavirus sp.]|uniref:Glycosyltransferase 2-like domain-containing protein n=1 Tax=Homavirus sp. TaxID=2487769 RepID=A0A3G5A480_9VIRU|nr:MAG: hypothetical protein Homavirus3_6 [Homavirus sp.]